jgi:arsenite-transporting ATPase
VDFLDRPTRNLFFTGKGGVGKTSLACATAVVLAQRGLRVLLVSTDPASNLDEVLGVRIGAEPTQVPGAEGLRALNLDPVAAAARYRERMVGPYRGVLPPAAIASMEEQFSGSCTTEIAAFDEFSRLLGDPSATSDVDHVVFDTAPTGHTLRLLTLPSAWSGFLEENTTGTSCLGPLAGLASQQQLYQQTVRSLADAERTTFLLVARPERSALREASRTGRELAELGIHNWQLLVNGVFVARDPSDPWAAALQRRGEQALADLPEDLRRAPRMHFGYFGQGTVGLDALRSLAASGLGVDDCGPGVDDSGPGVERANVIAGEVSADKRRASAGHAEVDGGAARREYAALPPLRELADELAARGHGVVLAMGKGGVGKTTVAAALALALADRGLAVHLSTTDPAAHLVAAMSSDPLPPTLTIGRIDPQAETERYSQEVLGRAGAELDARGRALLEEDLRSPCTEEIAVFRAFADTVALGSDRLVVLDTAPTGHTVLLLDAALAYHREVSRQASHLPDSVRQLLPRLRDPAFTCVLVVTLPEATPVHEASALQEDLRRAAIEPWGWVINQSLLALPVTDPGLVERQRAELRFVEEVVHRHAARSWLVDWQPEPPVGCKPLRQLLQHASSSL